MTPEAVVEVVRKDRSFYGRTDGGVTFSGGEPLGQIDFLEQTLRLCKVEKINTAIETCGCAPWENLQRAALLSDVFLYDIKHLDDGIHRAFTGAPCSPILENCRRLVKVARQVIIRVPVIPQFNFDEETMTRIVRFAEALGVPEVDFLPFHRLAANKYRYLSRTYWNPGINRLTAEEVQAVTGKIQTPLKIKIGG